MNVLGTEQKQQVWRKKSQYRKEEEEETENLPELLERVTLLPKYNRDA